MEMMNSLDSLTEWISLQNVDGISPNAQLYQEFGNFFTYLFNSNQDGICLLDPSLTIICVNNTMVNWYGHKAPFNGKKCYKIYHDRDTPCTECPTMETLKKKSSVSLLVSYETKYAQHGNQRLTTFPVLNEKKEVIAVIEHIRDISSEEKEKDALVKLNSMLDEQTRKLMEQNIALRVLGTQLSKDSHLVINEMSMKLDSIISPLIDQMKYESVDANIRRKLEILDQQLGSLVKPFLSDLPLDKLNLSPREIQLAAYIKEGHTSKEISDLLCISKKTVDFHRTNLRRKLKLDDGQSLQAYLLKLGTSTR